MSTAVDTVISAPRLSADTRLRLMSQLFNEHGIGVSDAYNIITDTESFLAACAANPDLQLRPSKRVDMGWHQFILNTHDYAEFCNRIAGRFIHHVPDEFESPHRHSGASTDILRPTVEAITAAGLPLHPYLWEEATGKCSQCHSGCSNCGQTRTP